VSCACELIVLRVVCVVFWLKMCVTVALDVTSGDMAVRFVLKISWR
jgi:hypothetical protein